MAEKEINIDQVISGFLRGTTPSGLVIDNNTKTQYEKSSDLIIKNPLKFVDKYSPDTWLIPEEYKNINVEEFILKQCETDEERKRVKYELLLFKEKELDQLLRFLIFLVDHFREHKYVWGVGRGSSVSSYVLYLIGIHKIDSIKYGLEIEEFLRD